MSDAGTGIVASADLAEQLAEPKSDAPALTYADGFRDAIEAAKKRLFDMADTCDKGNQSVGAKGFRAMAYRLDELTK